MPDTPTGSEELLRREILADAQRKVKRNLTKAERAAKKTLDGAQKEAERIVSLARGQAEMRAKRESASAQASLGAEVRRIELSARERLIERIFERALEEQPAREESERRQVLEALTSAALAAMEGDRFTATVAPGDAPLLDDVFLERIRERAGRTVHIRAQTGDGIKGGVKLAAEDGRLLYDNTLRARLERLTPALRLAVAHVLFVEGEKHD